MVEKNTVTLDQVAAINCGNPAFVKFVATSANPNVTYDWSEGSSKTNELTVAITTKDTAYYGVNKGVLHLVGLTVTSKGTGCIVIPPLTGTLIQVPNALYITSRAKGCVPHLVHLTDSSFSPLGDKIVEWKWDMGNGVIITNTTNATIDYT